MNPRKILTDLTFVGEVAAKRQTYYVDEDDRYYILMTVSRSKVNSFNFNLLPKEAAHYVRQRSNGRKKPTSSDVAERSRGSAYIKKPPDALSDHRY